MRVIYIPRVDGAKILLLEHVNYFAINRFSPIVTGIYRMVNIEE